MGSRGAFGQIDLVFKRRGIEERGAREMGVVHGHEVTQGK